MDAATIDLVTRLTQAEGTIRGLQAVTDHLAERIRAIDQAISDKQAQDASDKLQAERTQMAALRVKAEKAGVTLDG